MNDIIDQDLISDALNWLSSTYQAEGLVGTIVYLIIGGVMFGGLGFLFYQAAKANAKGMKKDE